jgi:hypothetical protein
MSALPLIAAFLIIAAIVVVRLRRKYQGSKAVTRFASQHGLDYLGTSGVDLLGYNFPLLHRGSERGCNNVLVGRWQDLPVKEADYWYSDSTPDSGRVYANFSIVIADLAVDVPYASIHKKTLLTKAAEHLGADHVNFGSEEFNRKFQVTSPDTDFAVKLIDAGMMRWLLGDGDRFGFEVADNHLLVSSHPVRPAELPLLFNAAKNFTDHIPRKVRADYGPTHPGGPPVSLGQ